jgi:hypothetical protein
MRLLALVNEDINRTALRAARNVGGATPLALDGFNSPLDNKVMAEVTKIWDKIEQAITSAYQSGIGAAKPLIDEVESCIGEFVKGVSKTAQQIRTVIFERLHVFLKSAIDGALQRVQATISVGGQELKMKSVTVEQKVSMSTSIKASLTEICEFVADGEITLSAPLLLRRWLCMSHARTRLASAAH